MENNNDQEGYFKAIFSKKKITHLFISNMIGNFIGFTVGFITTNMFSHYEHARRGINNLFGILPRKEVLVDDTPGWLHWTISVLLGFIAMETFQYLYNAKKHLILWNKLRMMGKKE
ncbi:MAG: hypothetical protein ACXVPU_08000 [Bacteroidia bacterium]